MNLESQLVQLEDLGRQVLMNGTRLDVVEMCRRIDAVGKDDLVRTARRVLYGEKNKSVYEFNGSKHWTPSGDGRPSVVVHAPLFAKDSLLKIEETMGSWGLMGEEKKGWF